MLTNETARRRVAPLQARGQWGPRDFDKVMWTLPIAEFDLANPLHTARRQIRTALTEDGVAGQIDELVTELLGVRL